jgi:hypothetical protein
MYHVKAASPAHRILCGLGQANVKIANRDALGRGLMKTTEL